jgi:hypothetical protein
MQREIPPAVFVVVLVLVIAIAGYMFYRSGRTPEGAGVTREDMRKEFLKRAQSGQLPISPEQKQRLLQGQGK